MKLEDGQLAGLLPLPTYKFLKLRWCRLMAEIQSAVPFALPRRAALVTAIVALSALGLHGSSAQDAGHRAHLSTELLAHQSRHTTARARVIVHGSDVDVDAIAQRHHLAVVRRFAGGAVLAASSVELSALSADAAIDHLSGDLPVRNTMSVSNASTGADQTKAGSASGLLGLTGISAVNGQGVGVAVVDSGISAHDALARRVVASVSFVTGDPSTDDGFGHGTHVAGIIAGAAGPATRVTPLYTGGIAPGVSLVSVRVLNDEGVGYTSDVIDGIEWVIANRAKYNIRVINLSLGHAVTEPCVTDPLCEEVGRAVSAGLVVVAAAGNNGVTPDGHTELGGITSPGNSPAVITVGALNTWGTVARGDDTVTTYSSRGPTAYDFAVKPDLAAPGNKIISLEATGSYLSTHYAGLHRAGSGTNAYMQLSGTSMATPMVSGAVALLLQGAPGLSPAQVKLALQMGATYMPDAGLIGAGAGSMNVWASRKITASGLLSALTSTLLNGVLTNSSGVAFWDAGTLSHRVYTGEGLRLLSAADALLAWLNPSLLKVGDLNLLGLGNPLARVTGNQLVWGQVAGWTGSQDEILWGTSMSDGNGDEILWGTSGGDEILWGTSTNADGVLTGTDPR
jgi:serine protease AprX